MIEGLLAPLRVVLKRSYADWVLVAATWLVILCAATLVAVGVIYGDAVATTGLRAALADEAGTDTSVVIQSRAPRDEVGVLADAVDRQAGRILGWTGGELIEIARSETYGLPDDDGDELTDLAIIAAFDGIERHATLSAGTWPSAGAEPMEVALSEIAATDLDLVAGDVIELRAQRGEATLPVRIAGTWTPNDRDDAYWQGNPLELEGQTTASSFRTHGPFVAARDDLLGRAVTRSVDLEWRVLPAFDALAVDDVEWMRSDVAALERRLTDVTDDAFTIRIDTELDSILADASRSLLVSRSGVVALTIQFAVLAGYALLLVAALLVDQRRVETALLRSRGAGTAHVAFLALLEAVVLVVPAVLLAPWAAVGAIGLLNVAGPLADAGVTVEARVGEAALLAAAGAGLVAILGLILPVLGAGRGLAVVRQAISRQGTRPIAQRVGFDLALVLLAGIGLWQLRQYGAPLTQTVRGTFGLDPLLVAAPAISLLAGAILALRIVPLAAELVEHVLVSRRGLVAPLGARQLARRPLRYSRSALLLMLAAALGTFAGSYASTWTASQADQAGYRVGADVRVEVDPVGSLPGWAIGPAIRAADGVEAALPASTDRFEIGGAAVGQILAIDADAARRIAAVRPDLASTAPDTLLATLADRAGAEAGLTLGDVPDAVRVELRADLAPIIVQEDSVTFSPGTRGILPALVIRDGDGVVHHLPAPRLQVGGGSQSFEMSLVTDVEGRSVRPTAPISVLGVTVEVELPDAAQATGVVGLERLEVVAGGVAAELDLGARPPRHVASEADPLNGYGAARTTPVPLRVGVPLDEVAVVPALASEGYLARTGARVGDTIQAGQLTTRRAFEIIGTLSAFPTLDPTEPFLVVDLGALALADEARNDPPPASGWWVDTPGGASVAVADRLRAIPSVGGVVAYDELHGELLTDPVALGVVGALLLGALASLIFATIGFVASAMVSARERLGEFALLQALGLSHRQLSAWITLENAFLLVIGLLVGTGIGLALAWVVLPFITLTQEATLAVPPVVVVYPWATYAAVYLFAGVALGVTVLVVGGLLGRVRVSGVLRTGGE